MRAWVCVQVVAKEDGVRDAAPVAPMAPSVVRAAAAVEEVSQSVSPTGLRLWTVGDRASPRPQCTPKHLSSIRRHAWGEGGRGWGRAPPTPPRVRRAWTTPPSVDTHANAPSTRCALASATRARARARPYPCSFGCCWFCCAVTCTPGAEAAGSPSTRQQKGGCSGPNPLQTRPHRGGLREAKRTGYLPACACICSHTHAYHIRTYAHMHATTHAHPCVRVPASTGRFPPASVAVPDSTRAFAGRVAYRLHGLLDEQARTQAVQVPVPAPGRPLVCWGAGRRLKPTRWPPLPGHWSPRSCCRTQGVTATWCPHAKWR
jgi:hypothetical protein